MPREISFPKGLHPVLSSLIPSLLSGLAVGLSFPPFSLDFLAWFSLVPLLVSNPQSARKRFLHGLLAGFAANLMIFFWLWKTFSAAGVGFVTTLGCWVALSFVLSLYWGVFKAGQLKGMPLLWEMIFLAALWIVLEWVRSWILTGFPWAFLSHTQADHPIIIQIASLGGAWMVSFLIVLSNVFFAGLLRKFRDQTSSGLTLGPSYFLFGTLLSGALIFGWIRLSDAPETSPRPFRIALLQGNIDQYEKWSDAYEDKIRAVYEDLSNQTKKEKPDLIIWPESAVPGWFPNEEFYTKWVKNIAVETGLPHVIGSVTSQAGKEFNSAFLIGPEGNVLDRYDKTHLVPFGEYIPFGKLFSRWIPYLGQLGSFDPGEFFPVFVVKGVTLFPTICYEAMFPSLVRRGASQGADVILNLTNDGWYLDTGAPAQHLAGNVFRAVELGIPVVRCANSGISAVIDARGRFILKTGLLQRGVYSAEVPLQKGGTIFGQFGNWFPFCCLGAIFLFYGFLLTRQRRLI